MTVVSDPTSKEHYVIHVCSTDPESDEFEEALYLAYFSVLYDHPELFWLYNALETDLFYVTPADWPENMLFFYLTDPYRNYEDEMTAFNEATEEFLSDIDLTQSEDKIALQIHDKLVETVTYDYAVAEAGRDDLAHTAYGALVANSAGDPHTAVCDGYALAYEYLLQQAGIDASVVLGSAGATWVTSMATRGARLSLMVIGTMST